MVGIGPPDRASRGTGTATGRAGTGGSFEGGRPFYKLVTARTSRYLYDPFGREAALGRIWYCYRAAVESLLKVE
jgi:hypothetical protein